MVPLATGRVAGLTVRRERERGTVAWRRGHRGT